MFVTLDLKFDLTRTMADVVFLIIGERLLYQRVSRNTSATSNFSNRHGKCRLHRLLLGRGRMVHRSHFKPALLRSRHLQRE